MSNVWSENVGMIHMIGRCGEKDAGDAGKCNKMIW